MTKLIIAALSPLEYVSILAVVIALIFSIITSKHHLSNQLKWYRYLLNVLHLIAFIALLGLIIQPQYETNKKLSVKLYTNSSSDFDKQSSTSYLLEPTSKIGVFASRELIDKYPGRILQTPEQLMLKHPSISKLQIIGDGLAESQWQNFPNIEIDYHPPILIPGILQPNWNSSINLGDILVFSGRLQSDSKGIHIAKLFNPAGDLVAEKNVLTGELFELSSQPKLAGNHQYEIAVFGPKQQQISRESIAINVTAISSAKILVLQSSPSFETKQLQNWAAENGTQFLLRTKVSKNVYTSRSTNISQQQVSFNKTLGLSKQLFDQFDLLIIDGRALLTMSADEKLTLTSSVEQGLGLLVLVDHDLLALSDSEWPEILLDFQLTSLAQTRVATPYLIQENLTRLALPETFIPLVAHSLSSNTIEVNLERLVEAYSGNILIAQKNKLLGRVAMSLLQETHRLVTAGKKQHYSQLWQHLINNISRRNQADEVIYDSEHELSFKNHLLKLCLNQSSNIAAPLKKLQAKHYSQSTDTHTVLLQPDLLIKNRYCGYFWPRRNGWYKINAEKQVDDKLALNSKFIHIEDNTAWLSHQQNNKILATKRKQALFDNNQSSSNYSVKINQWIFWWMFFIAASLIWIERKYRSVI